MARSRFTAEERRDAVLAVAINEFATSGYSGTSTDSIAAKAEISQPYLFRLFGTKKDLFIATYQLVAKQIEHAFREASNGLEGEIALHAMGSAYLELMQRPGLLQVQLHGFAAAAADPDIAQSCRGTFDVLWHLVSEQTGLGEEAIRAFFAQGMLFSVMSAIDLLSIQEPWALSFCPDPNKVGVLTDVARGRVRSKGNIDKRVS